MDAATVRVWDPFVRIFHWSLVVLFTLAWLTGEEENWLHNWAGYAILALLVARIAWGLIGSRYARFSAFVRSPVAALRYLRGLVDGTAPRFLGHNPAGGWMAILLLATLLATGGSGLIVLGLEGGGPLAGRIDARGPLMALVSDVGGAARVEDEEAHETGEDEYEDDEGREAEGAGAPPGSPGLEAAEEAWEAVHEFLANLALFLVVVHVLGVLASSRVHRENLIRSMFTGRKRTG